MAQTTPPTTQPCSHQTANEQDLYTCRLTHINGPVEDVIKADPFFGRSRVRFRVPPGFRTQLHETTSLGQEEAL